MDSKLLHQSEDLMTQPPDPVEMPVPATSNIWDSPLIPAILVGAMLAAGFIPIIFGR